MVYLDYSVLDALDERAFQARKPYPWANPEGALSEAGRKALRDTLPPLSLFEKRMGEERRHGQQPHDRYALEYRPELDLSPAWTDFMAELHSERYHAFLQRMLGAPTELSFHWHYTPGGCSVSPHCDAVHKLGSHIFYMNSDEDWDPAWGGETLVLDDGGRFPRRSAPGFDDFDSAAAAKATANHSFLFARRG
ncbi:MAG: hypothetical protein VX574_02990, partial [Myxococcota bacterium]|nr:hypothetical protein [Myxococcota bacterium]